MQENLPILFNLLNQRSLYGCCANILKTKTTLKNVREKKEKYQIIEALSDIGELSKLVENLLKNSGLKNVVRKQDTTIFAIQSGVIDAKYCYIPTLKPLGGKE